MKRKNNPKAAAKRNNAAKKTARAKEPGRTIPAKWRGKLVVALPEDAFERVEGQLTAQRHGDPKAFRIHGEQLLERVFGLFADLKINACDVRDLRDHAREEGRREGYGQGVVDSMIAVRRHVEPWLRREGRRADD